MEEFLTRADQTALIDLIDRAGLITTVSSDRMALLIEIGINTSEVAVDGVPHTVSVLLVDHLVKVENRDALRALLLRISARIQSQRDPRLAHLQQEFGINVAATDTAAESSAPTPVSAAPVAAGLVAFEGLTQDPRIRDTALRFSTVFETACKQMEEVTGYKSLHDQLHELQTKVLDPMEKAAPDFPGDEEAQAELNEYRIDFEDINQKLRDIAKRFSLADTSWIPALEAALEDFRAALERRDPALLKDVIKRIDRLLTLHPSRINTRLNAAARTLQLAELVRALSELTDDAARIKPNSERVRQFRAGVAALDRMEKTLSSLVQRHDYWQDFDSNLQAMEKNPKPEDLLAWWPDIKEMIDHVAESYGTEPWIAFFLTDCHSLESDIQAGEMPRISRSFRQVHRQVSKRFYNTDADLKSQCDELLKVGEPLARVLKVTNEYRTND